ncbi:MAG: ABC transporter ATP-binding protein [Acetobacteraceae bacterium]
MSFLQLETLTKRYARQTAVDGVSLSLDRGQCLVLLGPSGCGKTTILNLIAGFLQPDAGRIRVDGADVTGLPPHRRDMGMVFQDYALFPHMTLRQNVSFGLRMRGIARAEQDRRVHEALASVGLAELAARRPAQLSGGQRQRVALARALVIRPRLLLFDEPLSNLDAQLREQLRTEIRTVLDSAGITSIFVTHDQSEALALADRVALLRDGKVEQFGPPSALYDRPASQFAARFVGGCNLIAGEVVGQREGAAVIRLPGGSVTAPGNDAAGRRIVLAIRPHRLRLDPDGPWRGTVQTVEFLGAQTRVTLRNEAEAVVVDLPRPVHGLARGQDLRVSWDPADSWPLPA